MWLRDIIERKIFDKFADSDLLDYEKIIRFVERPFDYLRKKHFPPHGFCCEQCHRCPRLLRILCYWHTFFVSVDAARNMRWMFEALGVPKRG